MNPDEMTPEQHSMSANTPTQEHSPMAYETFVLLKAALEKELEEKGKLQYQLAAAVAECARLKAELVKSKGKGGVV